MYEHKNVNHFFLLRKTNKSIFQLLISCRTISQYNHIAKQRWPGGRITVDGEFSRFEQIIGETFEFIIQIAGNFLLDGIRHKTYVKSSQQFINELRKAQVNTAIFHEHNKYTV